MNNSDLFHSWAHQQKDYAKGSHCSYSGRICYSYNTAIGLLVDFGDKTLAILSTERHSNTTSRHQSYAYRAVHNLYPYIQISNDFHHVLNSDFDEIFKFAENQYLTSINECLDELSNKRKKAIKIIWNLKYLFNDLKYLYLFAGKDLQPISNELVTKIVESNRFDVTFPTLHEWFQYATDEIFNTPRKQFIQKSQDEIVELWRNGKRQGLGNLRLNKTLLRYRPKVNRIETSKGISFSTVQAESFWQDIQDAVKSSVEKSVNYLGFNGHINSDGSLKIGCHEIEYSEILNLAKQLQLC